jgi:hypothetical protein
MEVSGPPFSKGEAFQKKTVMDGGARAPQNRIRQGDSLRYPRGSEAKVNKDRRLCPGL